MHIMIKAHGWFVHGLAVFILLTTTYNCTYSPALSFSIPDNIMKSLTPAAITSTTVDTNHNNDDTNDETATTAVSFSGLASAAQQVIRNIILQTSRGGGRAPSTPNKIDRSTTSTTHDDDEDDEPWEVTPSLSSTEVRLIVLQITDVYTLENFASFKTLLMETRAKAGPGTKVVCVLTGDFLSPYLLSSIDRGAGMMRALCNVPFDYLTWGNHEADIEHRTVCRHVKKFYDVGGKWINSNMLDHEMMQYQQEYDVIDLASADGSHQRKIGLCAVLSDDKGLYSHFKNPGAFGGATLTDPWEALDKYNNLLISELGCDFVLPMEHLYVPDDHITCQKFDFPVILSGHDHHRVDEVVDGTRLLKPGMNGVYATVLEISWLDAAATKPNIRARFVKCDLWEPDPILQEQNERAYEVLAPMRNTELAQVPSIFEPLSSNGSREMVCTMGKYICTLIKSSMNVFRRQRAHIIDAVLLMGGNIRGNADYEVGSFFSLEMLEAEVKADEVVAVVPMPGWLLAQGIQATHAGEPISGWIQYDEGIVEDTSCHPPIVTHVGHEPIDLDRIYRVATKISDLRNGQSPPWTEYYTKHPEVLPPKGAYVNIHAELMTYFARNLWRKLWDSISADVEKQCTTPNGSKKVVDDECILNERLDALDLSGDGTISVEEIQIALRDRLGYSVDDREKSLAEFVHSFADMTGDGTVTRQDLKLFSEEFDDIYKLDELKAASEIQADLETQLT